MVEVVIFYKEGTVYGADCRKEILEMAERYNYLRIGCEGGLCINMNDESAEAFRVEVKKLGYVERVEFK